MKKALAVLISGTGRNLQAILDAIEAGQIDAEPVCVISNRPGVAGLARARSAGVPTQVIDHEAYPDRISFDRDLAATIDNHGADLVALAGFMRILTPRFVRRYHGRLFNIHPSLLPKYPGLHTHRRVLESGDEWHGASVHFVTEELDGGPVILQGSVRIEEGDTEDTLARRVMDEVELNIYPRALSWAANGRLALHESGVELDGRLLQRPVDLASICD